MSIYYNKSFLDRGEPRNTISEIKNNLQTYQYMLSDFIKQLDSYDNYFSYNRDKQAIFADMFSGIKKISESYQSTNNRMYEHLKRINQLKNSNDKYKYKPNPLTEQYILTSIKNIDEVLKLHVETEPYKEATVSNNLRFLIDDFEKDINIFLCQTKKPQELSNILSELKALSNKAINGYDGVNKYHGTTRQAINIGQMEFEKIIKDIENKQSELSQRHQAYNFKPYDIYQRYGNYQRKENDNNRYRPNNLRNVGSNIFGNFKQFI